MNVELTITITMKTDEYPEENDNEQTRKRNLYSISREVKLNHMKRLNSFQN